MGVSSFIHGLSTFSNIFFETTGPIQFKFHMGTPKGKEKKVCTNVPGHKTKIAATPILGKNPLNISGTKRKGQWPWDLVCSIGVWALPSLHK